MKDHVTPRIAAATLVAAALFCHSPGVAADPPPVVVELFTSQGCNSCPPADRLLGELAKRDDVLPLGFHVTYWDRLGWPDTFGLAGSTERQESYAAWLGLDRLYTPQMVIGGRIDVVGGSRARVLEAIELLRGGATPGPTLTVTGCRSATARRTTLRSGWSHSTINVTWRSSAMRTAVGPCAITTWCANSAGWRTGRARPSSWACRSHG
jgi:hypothetical protein